MTGAGGFVGGSVLAQGCAGWELHAIHRGPASGEIPGARTHTLDLLDCDRLRSALAEIGPHAVVHCAALADIDKCEAEPDLAYRVNVLATAEIAAYCAATGARLVFLSTDTVFDGLRGMYREDDQPHPVNRYAETKVRAEEAVLTTAPGAVVARLSLVMGLPALAAGNSFLVRMLASWRDGKPVRVPADEVRTPIDVVTLSLALLELARGDHAGLVHLAGNEAVSRYEMAQRIARRLCIDERLVEPTHGAVPGRAPRPPDVSLDNSLARRILKTPMLDLDEAIELALAARQGETG